MRYRNPVLQDDKGHISTRQLRSRARRMLRIAAATIGTFVLLAFAPAPTLNLTTSRATAAPVQANSDSPEEVKTNESKAASKRIAIVIDDFGNGMTGTAEMMKLPFPFTVAVMPFMPTTKSDAETAHKLGHDVIVHMPMEPKQGKKEWLGPGALTTDMPDSEIRKRVEAAIDNVPFAVGMNNHMGSKVTADERVMRIVLQVCKERGLFFLDSRTTYKTVIPKVAAELDVPLVSNDVFLDDVYSVAHISKQIGMLRKHLEEHEKCVAIGHVGPSGKKTAAVLLSSTPSLRENAVIVKVAELVRGTSDQQILP